MYYPHSLTMSPHHMTKSMQEATTNSLQKDVHMLLHNSWMQVYKDSHTYPCLLKDNFTLICCEKG